MLGLYGGFGSHVIRDVLMSTSATLASNGEMESLFGIIDRNMRYICVFKMQKVQMAYAALRFAFHVKIVVRHICGGIIRPSSSLS